MKKIGKTIGMIMLSVGSVFIVKSLYKLIKDAPTDTALFASGLAILLIGIVIKIFCEDFNNEEE